MKYAYLFEARGIQNFLFASGKLRDMLGGSELLDYMCSNNGYLDKTLNTLQLSGTYEFVRKAGSAFYIIFTHKEDAKRFQATWRLSCVNLFPGVESVDVLVESDSVRKAIKLGIEKLRESRNHLSADLPLATPITERSQRTGKPAVPKEGVYGPTDELFDAATFRQNQFKRPQDNESPSLDMRFLSLKENDKSYSWPINFEDNASVKEKFPLDERRFVGLLHADGNGLGELLRVINSACQNVDDAIYIDIYRTFSDNLTKATQAAAHDATDSVILKHANQYDVLPARPLVLGGDDLSILLRADIALEFTKVYLKAFEERTRDGMLELKKIFEKYQLSTIKLPDFLTACAGLCFMKCNQPFNAGYGLAEGLCSRAKKISRQAIVKLNAQIDEENKGKEDKSKKQKMKIPASIAFHKIQDSLIEDANTQYDQSFVFKAKNTESTGYIEYRTAFEAYGLDGSYDLPSIDVLEKLVGVFGESMNDRPLREIATLLRTDIKLAQSAYKRWRKITYDKGQAKLDRFDKLLAQLCGIVKDEPLPFSTNLQSNFKISPLADVLTLLTLFNRASQKEESLHAE